MDRRIDEIEAPLPAAERYPAIADYAVIGNCRTAALVSRQGSVDWLCLPHFSAPSFFAAMLDRRKGGRLAVEPSGVTNIERRYLDDTAVLETTFHCMNTNATSSALTVAKTRLAMPFHTPIGR